ncbi:MAG: MGMT family protein [Desulfovibrionaceae bacterium]|nr:MGMT family protein [Desulfovibrionaceae bacterium]
MDSAQKTNFFQQVYRLVASIPEGKVMTYGQIAQCLGGVYSARLVGFAMSACPEALPAHRVINRRGEMARGNIFGGSEAQRALLMAEGVPFFDDGRVNLACALYYPQPNN